MARFKLRGTAINWWRDLVNSRGPEGNLFEPPPSVEQEPVTLVNSIQPVMDIDPAQLSANPTVKPLALSAVSAFLVFKGVKSGAKWDHQASATGEAVPKSVSIPLYDRGALSAYVRSVYSSIEPGFHAVGTLYSSQYGVFQGDDKQPSRTALPKRDVFLFQANTSYVLGNVGYVDPEVTSDNDTVTHYAGEYPYRNTETLIGADTDAQVPRLETAYRTSLRVETYETAWIVVTSLMILYPKSGFAPNPAEYPDPTFSTYFDVTPEK